MLMNHLITKRISSNLLLRKPKHFVTVSEEHAHRDSGLDYVGMESKHGYD